MHFSKCFNFESKKDMSSKIRNIVWIVAIFFQVAPLIGRAQIDAASAQRAALAWFYDRSPFEHDDISVKEVKSIEEDGYEVLYAVNMFPAGFVLVSGHKGIIPVAAYSFTSWYDESKMPPAAELWIQHYRKEVADAFRSGSFWGEKTKIQWDELLNMHQVKRFSGKAVEPLTYGNWNQDWPYNELCPADPSGPHGHCYAGCVPTAMGLIMYYYRWPDTGVGYYSYTQSPYGLLEADFGNTHYAWDEMTNEISDSDTAIARLLFHIGVSCDLVYGPNGSGMYNHKAAYAFRTFFKYAPETQYVFRDSTNMNWDSLLVAHLDRKMPLYYAGWSVPNVNGHAFVCDGYQGTGYYHFNFGWGGSYNGYYYTQNLTPGGNNFNLAQEVIINCHPDTINYNYPGLQVAADTLRHYVGSFSDGSGPRLPQYSQNRTWLISPQNAIDSISSIKLSFSRFDLKDGESFVNVYDGSNASAPLLGTYTGENLPQTIQSSGNKLFVEYIGSNSTNDDGFVATYEGIKPQWCVGNQTLTAPAGFLSDGSGTFWYYNNTVCIWRIQPPDSKEIALYFTRFSTELGQDKLRIYDYTTAQLLAEYSGHYDSASPPPAVLCPSGKLFLTFNTNGSVRDDGREAYYESYYTGISITNREGIKIYPNPAKDRYYVYYPEFEVSKFSVDALSADGRCNRTLNLKDNGGGVFEGNTHDLAPGIWFLRFTSRNGVSVIKLIVK
ncbi:MAG: hypothetical protein PWP35_2366 [Bacteroidales bacterium]|nr:hypothetical protein [Bacteroidales bacterium]